jgi:hypothetical protein
MAARPSTMIHTQAGRPAAFFEVEGLVHHDFLPQRHESDCLHNRTATPSRCNSSETASQMIFRYLASAPRQCAITRGPECQGILGQAQNPRGFPRFGPLRLLPLPQAEEHPEVETISRRRGDTTKYDTAVAGHSRTSLPDMHWNVEGSLESLRTIWRVVLWTR